MRRCGRVRLATMLMILGSLALPAMADAQQVSREVAMRAAVHPVSTSADMHLWLSRVPVTRDFPPDFQTMLRDQAKGKGRTTNMMSHGRLPGEEEG